MKSIKVSMMAAIAILLGFCGSAFTAAPEKATYDEWFLYDGTGDVNDPINYTYSGSIESCNSNVHFCAMKGVRQASPNQNLPTQESLNSASDQSSDFSIPVTGVVVFKP